MKRLSAQLGITYFFVLAVAFYLSEPAVFILGCIALAACAVLLIVRRTRRTVFIPAMAAIAFAACLVNLCYTSFYVEPLVQKYSGFSHRVEAVLSDESYLSYSRSFYPLKVVSVDGEAADFSLLLKCGTFLDAEPDDKLIFEAELNREQADHNRARGYYLDVDEYYIPVRIVKAESHSLYYHVIRLRDRLREALRAYLPPDCSSLCEAVFIGDKYSLDFTVRENFRYAGASYLIVVSGMHFAVLCGLLLRLLRRVNRWVRLGIMLCFIFLYMAVTGFRPPVLRSGVMMIIFVVGSTVRRQTYSPGHLGIAGLLLPFFVSPYGAGDIGLILSFSATLAILLWANPIMSRISFKDSDSSIYRLHIGYRVGVRFKRLWLRIRPNEFEDPPDIPPFEPRLIPKMLWNGIAAVIAVSLAANILVLPLSIYFFRAFSVVTLLSAVLLYGWIYLILILSLAVAVFYWLGPLSVIALILSWPLYLCCRVVLWLVELLGGLPFALIPVREDFYIIWIIVTAVLIAAAFALRKRRLMPFAVLCSLIMLICGMIAISVMDLNTLALHVYPCGDGMITGIESRGRLYLFTADANSKSLYSVMRQLSDDYGGAAAVLSSDERELSRYKLYTEREFAISDILMYDSSGTIPESAGLHTVHDGSVFILDDGLILRTAVKDGSVIPYITAGERDILIVPCDADISCVPKDMRSPDVIVMPGSAKGFDTLSCTDLIISSAEPLGGDMPDHENICSTLNGEVVYDLR